MVQSGLTERIDVSQYRLALHLCMAFLILGAILWTWADLRQDRTIYLKNIPPATWSIAIGLTGLIFLQVALGAFVAGTKAGLVFNTWPLMNDQFIPDGLYELKPRFINIFEHHLTIQFNHRMMAYLLVALVLLQAVRLWSIDNDWVRHTSLLLAALMAGQAILGIWTLLAAEATIPIGLGVAHQTLAAIVFAASVMHLHAVLRAYR